MLTYSLEHVQEMHPLHLILANKQENRNVQEHEKWKKKKKDPFCKSFDYSTLKDYLMFNQITL